MRSSEDAMQALRDAIRAEMIEEIEAWWTRARADYQEAGGADDAIEDAIITLKS